jgi:2'-5' RNA ligase
LKYGIVIFPSKALQDKANSLRKRYDSNYGLIPPHVTLKYPFEANEKEMETFVQALRDIAKDVHPFTLTSGNVSSFYPTNTVIYFKIAPSEALTTLNAKMHEGVFPTTKEYTFVPHLTIGQYLSDAEHADVLGRLRMIDYQYEEVIDRFHLLYELEDGSWTVYETFHLGKECH